MNEIHYIDFSLTVTVASLKYKMQKTFKEKYKKNINKGKKIENEKYQSVNFGQSYRDVR